MTTEGATFVARAIPAPERRSGRIPAEPYPPPRCYQFTLVSIRIAKKDLPAAVLARYDNTGPALVSLAAFEVSLIGRFCGVPRGYGLARGPLGFNIPTSRLTAFSAG